MKIMKLNNVKITILVCLLISGCLSAKERFNVLFVAIDDLNDWVGVFGGNSQVKTPNLDRFNANGGMVMSDAHVPSTVCGPSRSAILTGKFPHNTGVYGNKNNLRKAPLAKDLLTIPQYFSKHGYHTLTRGKIFHVHPSDEGPRGDQGQWAFDEWSEAKGWVPPLGDQRPTNGLPNLPNDKKNYHSIGFDWGPTAGNDETKMKDYCTALWASDQFQNRQFEKPFFMAVGMSKPHLPWHVPQKYFDMYPLDEIILPEVIPNDLDDILNKWGKPIDVHSTWQRVETFGQRHKEAVQAYLATITFVDDCIGALLEGLEQSPYSENTIVMLWSDHGWHLGEKQRYGKTQLWQETCRVPFMVKVPGVTRDNIDCKGIVNLIDMYPTLIDLCGIPKNPDNDGRSFAQLLRDPLMDWNKPILSDYNYGGHRVYDGRYSYIVFEKAGTEELYDHKVDPMEWNNLIRMPEYAQTLERLKKHIPLVRQQEAPRN
ncbi:MAG: iduronate sulfatase [Coraliomargarita sp.]|nr:iduronate sulfatase [Coraliomargarita sp.]|tara:strand:- start:4708 stop:6159 length:1452 start_codon:yes stop_codon:yes gene_type:complete